MDPQESQQFPKTLTLGTIDTWGFAHYFDENRNEYLFAPEELAPAGDDEDYEQEHAPQHPKTVTP
jgi:hypothetical protein